MGAEPHRSQCMRPSMVLERLSLVGNGSLWLLAFWQLTYRDGFGNIEVRGIEPCLLRMEIIVDETCSKCACQIAKELQILDFVMIVDKVWFPRFST